MASRFIRERKIHETGGGGLELNAVTLAAERTSTVQSGKSWRHLSVTVDLTARSGTTALLCKLLTSDNRTTLGQTKSESISSGTGTLSTYTQSFATTTTGLTVFRFDLDDDFWQIKVSATGGAAGDVCTVTARLSD